MDDKSNPINYILACIGCILLFTLPIVAILAIWEFNPSKLKEGLTSIFAFNQSSSNDYNFDIPAGEDALLTSNIKNEGKKTEITPRSNPAKFIKIDSADIEGPVVYGQDGEKLLTQGFWHYPGSVYPGEQGSSVIFGHRRHHLPPAKDTFYNLDKINVGDRVEIQLKDGTWLEYTVIEVEVIDPADLFLLATEQSNEFLVKFITCTPLGTADKRLVVTASKTF